MRNDSMPYGGGGALTPRQEGCFSDSVANSSFSQMLREACGILALLACAAGLGAGIALLEPFL